MRTINISPVCTSWPCYKSCRQAEALLDKLFSQSQLATPYFSTLCELFEVARSLTPMFQEGSLFIGRSREEHLNAERLCTRTLLTLGAHLLYVNTSCRTFFLSVNNSPRPERSRCVQERAEIRLPEVNYGHLYVHVSCFLPDVV